MSEIMLEVDEELRAQQLKALWQRYGQWAIGVFLVAVLAVSGGTAWHQHVDQKLRQQTDTILQALQDTKRDNAARQEKLAALATNTSAPLNGVVLLQQAQTLEVNNQPEQARALYKKLADDNKTIAVTRQLAIYHAVRLGIVARKDTPDTLLSMLSPLTVDGAPFRVSALELKGILLLQKNDVTAANAVFTALSTDSTAPETLRRRAESLIQYKD